MTTGTVGGPSGYYQAGERCLALAEWPDFSDQKHVAELLKKARVRIVEMIDQLTTTA